MKIDGKQIAEEIFKSLKLRIEKLKEQGTTPRLAVILVGQNPASVAYVLLKQRKGEEIGATVDVYKYNEDVTNEEIFKKVEELNSDNSVHGILIQRPLPPQIDVSKLELLTNPQKDVDGFHPDSPFTLPLPLAVIKILEEVYKIKEKDENLADFIKWLDIQNIIVLGKGPTGGGPIIEYLKKLKVNYSLIDSKTPNPDEQMRKADIIISSVGREDIIKPDTLKKGVILVGVGILRGKDGKLHGDYSEEEIKNIAGYYTPTPGGVGPVNVAELLENLLIAAEKNS